jgi:hypothetical protein
MMVPGLEHDPDELQAFSDVIVLGEAAALGYLTPVQGALAMGVTAAAGGAIRGKRGVVLQACRDKLA